MGCSSGTAVIRSREDAGEGFGGKLRAHGRGDRCKGSVRLGTWKVFLRWGDSTSSWISRSVVIDSVFKCGKDLGGEVRSCGYDHKAARSAYLELADFGLLNATHLENIWNTGLWVEVR